MTNYRVQKEYKKDGCHDYDILFESTNKAKAEAFLRDCPKSNKKIQYELRGFNKVTITKEDKKEAERIHNAIWNNSTFGEQL